MRRKRPYTEPDRIKERIRVIIERQAMALCIKAHADIPFDPPVRMFRKIEGEYFV